jgi:hypothetical protein
MFKGALMLIALAWRKTDAEARLSSSTKAREHFRY